MHTACINGVPKVTELHDWVVTSGAQERVFELDVAVDDAGPVAKVHHADQLLEEAPGFLLAQDPSCDKAVQRQGGAALHTQEKQGGAPNITHSKGY